MTDQNREAAMEDMRNHLANALDEIKRLGAKEYNRQADQKMNAMLKAWGINVEDWRG